MNRKKARYKRLETTVTAALCLDAIIFLAYLIFAGIGMIGLKITAAILCFIISGLTLYYLFITRELLRRRSLWMSLAAVCIIICVLASLLLKFPSPPYVLPSV